MTARQRIQHFLRTISVRYRAFRALQVVGAQALVWAMVVLLVEMLAPSWLGWAIGIAVAALALSAIGSLVRGRARLATADRELRLQDRLLTYMQLGGRRGGAASMLGWLEHDLDDRLRALPTERTAGLWRRPLGRTRYLIPIVLLVLLVRLFAPALPPIKPRGPQASANPPPASGGGGDQGESKEPDEGAQEPGDDPPPQEQPQPQPEPEPEPQPQQPMPGEGAERPPKPLIELEREESFVVPDFIGEGESRRSNAHVAMLPEGGATDPAARAGADETERAAPPPAAEFEKAQERALRARRVPEHERAFVKRYFEALVRREK